MKRREEVFAELLRKPAANEVFTTLANKPRLQRAAPGFVNYVQQALLNAQNPK